MPMKRILIYKQVIKNGEYDILNPIIYPKLAETIQKEYHGISPNWANRLWLQGILSEIQTTNNQYEFLRNDMDLDYINSTYDLIILPMANIFWVGYIKEIQHMAEIFKQINIPTFVIACGVQADSYDDLPTVVEQLRQPASQFIRAIYQTGGEFALRGEFTKEFFDRLGFHSAVVTGCPSLYQLGRNLKINSKHVDLDMFKPAFNGNIDGVKSFLEYYPQSEFFDQCEYFDLVYCSDIWGTGDYKTIKKLVRKYGYDTILLAVNYRIKLFPEMNKWSYYLKKQGFNFSFGSRIHGNVMSILSNIPTVIWTCDSRTREVAEYFDIPHVMTVPDDIYECYSNVDYTAFNRTFPKHFDKFEQFLHNCDIVDHICENNPFFNDNSFILESQMSEVLIPEGLLDVLKKSEKQLRLDKKCSDTIKRVYKKIKR